MGAEEVEVQEESLGVPELIERLRSMSKEAEPGFNSYNTLAMIDDGGAFVPAATKRRVKNGETVVLIPISHGG